MHKCSTLAASVLHVSTEGTLCSRASSDALESRLLFRHLKLGHIHQPIRVGWVACNTLQYAAIRCNMFLPQLNLKTPGNTPFLQRAGSWQSSHSHINLSRTLFYYCFALQHPTALHVTPTTAEFSTLMQSLYSLQRLRDNLLICMST